jgi:hypothetical protein
VDCGESATTTGVVWACLAHHGVETEQRTATVHPSAAPAAVTCSAHVCSKMCDMVQVVHGTAERHAHGRACLHAGVQLSHVPPAARRTVPG